MNIKDLTLDEKLKLLTGKNHWETEDLNGKIPTVTFCDATNGLRYVKQNEKGEWITEKSTAYPCSVTVANTWNPNIAKNIGQAVADECIEKNIDVLLGPGSNIKRTPICGRNFEYYSEDPLLAGLMAKAYIEGIQENGIGASLKHFCLNNREYERFTQSSEADERTMREIYLKAFEIALKAEPATVMCSYNPVNGVYASENKKLLNNTLRDLFGFKDTIISDWSAVHDRAKALKATLDIEMPFSASSFNNLKAAYERGFINDADIDFCIANIFKLIERKKKISKKIKFTAKQKHEIALNAAKEGIVLLKNEDILPLKESKIAVIGEYSRFPACGGGGSSKVDYFYQQKPLHDELSKRLGKNIAYARGYALYDMTQVLYSQGAKKAAYENDVVIIVVGLQPSQEGEGMDRIDIKLPFAYEKLINDVSAINKNTVVVIEAGSAIDMSSWIDNVKGVVFAGYCGEAVNEALADILSGNYNPCGKISETFPLSINDTCCRLNSGNGFTDTYCEGIFVGYRYYDTMKKQVLFPFGHGLSYSKFTYSDLKIIKNSETEYTVQYKITNTSDKDGSEISQVYVKDIFSTVIRPEKELKGFNKVYIKAGESQTVSINLDSSSFAYYSTVYDNWHVENGTFEIMVGASSADIKLTAKIDINLDNDTQHTIIYDFN